MPKATLINQDGQKVVVDSGTPQAQQYFSQGYSLMGAQTPQINAPVAPAGSVAIPGAQYNTQASQQANFSNIQPVGNTLYGVPKVAEKLTSDQLTGGTPAVTPVTPTPTTSATGTVASATEYMNQLNAEQAARQKQQAEAEAQKVAGTQKLTDLYEQLGKKGTEYTTELEKYNYGANVAQLQDINKQIASKTASFQNALTNQEARIASASSIYGRQALIERQQASEVGGLSAIAQALQGNITLAQQTAKDAIDVKYDPIEVQIQAQKDQLDSIYNDLSRADQLKADAQKAVLDERQRQIDEQKTEESNISNIVLTAAQNPNADINTLNAIRSAKTLDEAILIASGATPILTHAGLSGLTENQIIRVGNKIYKKGINLLAPQAEAGTWSIETDAAGNPYKFNATTGQSLNLDGTPRITDNNVIITGATAKSIANAIKQVESGGNYNASGASGENGAYQFMPATWESWSREYAKSALGVNTPLSMSKANQDFVAEFKIQQWLDQGLTPQQIAAKWNSGSEVGWENKIGVNKQGVAYNVPNYVNKFISTLGKQLGANKGEVSAMVELQASTIVTQISPRLANNKELIAQVAQLIASGAPMDDIEDELRYLSQSEKFEPWRNLANTAFSGVKMAVSERTRQLDIVDDYIASGDNAGAMEHIKTTILGAVGATEKKNVTGRDDALTSVYEIERLLDEYTSMGGNTGLLTGKVEDFNKKVLKRTGNSELAYIANEIAMAIQKYRQDLTGAAFTESEAKEYNSIFPSIGKSPTLNRSLINSLKSQYERNQRKFWERQLGGTANYNKLQNLAGTPIVGVGDLSRFSTSNPMPITNNYLTNLGY